MFDSTTAPKFKRRRFLAIVSILAIILALAGYFGRSAIRDAYENLLGNSYPGPGHGSVNFVIISGDTGEDVATNLVDQGIVKQFRSMYRLILDKNTLFYPGTYPMKLEMSNTDALAVLSDAKNSITNRVTVKEGWTLAQTFAALSTATGIAEAEFKDEAKDYQSFGVPGNAPSLEGFLFPATYAFDPSRTAKEIIQEMVDRMFEELNEIGITESYQFEILTLASIVQKEARLSPDFPKVARVFLNRIEIGMHLQSDATVSYGTGGTTVTTTDEQRADPNGYNTYIHPGLPIGPISNPGREAILAAMDSAEGEWLYFCTVNLETGETVFSNTYSEHLIAVRQFQSWLQENPGWND